MDNWLSQDRAVWVTGFALAAAFISLLLCVSSMWQWVVLRRRLNAPLGLGAAAVARQAHLLVWAGEAVRSVSDIIENKKDELAEADFARYFEYFAQIFIRILFDRRNAGRTLFSRHDRSVRLFRLSHGKFYISGARASFWVPTQDGKTLRLLAGCAPVDEMFKKSTLRIKDSVAGQALREGRLLIWPDDPEIENVQESDSQEGRYRTFMCVPVPSSVRQHGPIRSYGVLCMEAKTENAFTSDEIMIWMNFFADVVVERAAEQILGHERVIAFAKSVDYTPI